MIDLLKTGRANGARRLLRGVTAFVGGYTATPQPGRLLTVELAGNRDHSDAEIARLFDCADAYLSGAK